MIAVGSDEYLGLVAQAAEGTRVDNAVAVALKGVAWPARAIGTLGEGPAARSSRVRGKVFVKHHFVAIFSNVMPSGAV